MASVPWQRDARKPGQRSLVHARAASGSATGGPAFSSSYSAAASSTCFMASWTSFSLAGFRKNALSLAAMASFRTPSSALTKMKHAPGPAPGNLSWLPPLAWALAGQVVFLDASADVVLDVRSLEPTLLFCLRNLLRLSLLLSSFASVPDPCGAGRLSLSFSLNSFLRSSAIYIHPSVKHKGRISINVRPLC